MQKRCREAQWTGIPAMMVIAMAAGCGKPVVVDPPRPVTVVIDVRASESVNPDAGGRPSPVRVRIYQLADDTDFLKADLTALWADDAGVLAAALVSRQEFMLVPGGSKQGSMKLEPGTRHVAVAAAFRDFRSAEWRAVTATPQPPVPGTELALAVVLDASSVSASLTPTTNAGAAQ
jgi:type VI secretion system protein VasD